MSKKSKKRKKQVKSKPVRDVGGFPIRFVIPQDARLVSDLKPYQEKEIW